MHRESKLELEQARREVRAFQLEFQKQREKRLRQKRKEAPPRFYPFGKARAFVRRFKFQTIEEFRDWSKNGRPQFIPSNPQLAYKKFKGWRDWLGTPKPIPQFIEPMPEGPRRILPAVGSLVRCSLEGTFFVRLPCEILDTILVDVPFSKIIIRDFFTSPPN